MSNYSLKITSKNRIGLYRNNRLVKVFLSQMECAAFYSLTNEQLSRYLNNNRKISVLNPNEFLKKISDTTTIKFEKNQFKLFLAYLNKNDKLHFFCNQCLSVNFDTLPLATYQTVGLCECCNHIKEVSCGSLNKWLKKKNYLLNISDHSRFLIKMMPFEQVKTEKPYFITQYPLKTETPKEIQAIKEIQTVREIQTVEKIHYSKKLKKIISVPIRELKKIFYFLQIKYPIITYLVLTFGVIYIIFQIPIEDTPDKIYTVKAILLEKNSLDEFIIYKNEDGNVFKIPNALEFWDCGEKGDSVLVSFKYTPTTIKWTAIERIKNK